MGIKNGQGFSLSVMYMHTPPPVRIRKLGGILENELLKESSKLRCEDGMSVLIRMAATAIIPRVE